MLITVLPPSVTASCPLVVEIGNPLMTSAFATQRSLRVSPGGREQRPFQSNSCFPSRLMPLNMLPFFPQWIPSDVVPWFFAWFTLVLARGGGGGRYPMICSRA